MVIIPWRPMGHTWHSDGVTLRSYSYWLSHGEPYVLARPLAKLQVRLRGYGYTVYDYPNDAHLTADPPEDHTPFSATGWPNESEFGVGHADDIMPSGDPALPTIAEIAEQILLDKAAGLPELAWLKYMNWTDAAGNCWHESWEPNHERRPSTDKGHIHLSGRTDYTTSAVGDDYDPVARLRARKGKTVQLIRIDKDPRVWVTDGIWRNHVVDETRLAELGGAKLVKVYPAGTDPDRFGRDVAAPTPVVLDEATVNMIVEDLIAGLGTTGMAIDKAELANALNGIEFKAAVKP